MPIKDDEIRLTLILKKPTHKWLSSRAAQHGRSRLREAANILEAERLREARISAPGCLGAQGGAQ